MTRHLHVTINGNRGIITGLPEEVLAQAEEVARIDEMLRAGIRPAEPPLRRPPADARDDDAPAAAQTRADFLDEAGRIITQDRNRQYGEPEDLFAAIAMIWAGLDLARGARPRGAADVALYMQGLKAARASANPGHPDSWTDGIGYGACGGEIAAREAAGAKAEADRVAHNVECAQTYANQTAGGGSDRWHLSTTPPPPKK